jgi:hypothetical protein
MQASLPVFKIISGAFTFLWEKKLRMIRALSIPITILFIVEISPYLLLIIDIDYENISVSLFYLFTIGIFIITYAARILFAITCHRLVLIGNTGVPEYGMLGWTRREWWFLAYLIFLPCVYYLSMALNLMAIGLFKEFDININSIQILFAKGDGNLLLILLVALPSVYIFSRLSLLFPATAVDRDVDVEWAWKTSSKNGWRLTVIIILLPLLFVLLQVAQVMLWGKEPNWVEGIIDVLLKLILLAIEIIVLSFSYKHLTENQVVEAKS